jgi:hypothetical protein
MFVEDGVFGGIKKFQFHWVQHVGCIFHFSSDYLFLRIVKIQECAAQKKGAATIK